MFFSGRFLQGLIFVLILFVNIKLSITVEYIGCYRDTSDRALVGISASTDSMTVIWCQKLCRDNDYKYAGLQYGRECFCGNGGYDKYGESTNCRMDCSGNDGNVCGGYWANSVYSIGDYVGCFKDKPSRAMNELSETSDFMTVKFCKDLCRHNGYEYAGLQYGRECFCGNGGYDIFGESTNCRMDCSGNDGNVCGGYWANSVYRVGDSIGCFKDMQIRAMNDLFKSSLSMTVKLCKDHCRDHGFMYAALQYGRECFCGNNGYDKYGKSMECDMPCEGNEEEYCGGFFANSVFKVGDSIGCFADDVRRAMADLFKSSDFMTVKLCKDHCRDNGYKYAALQFGKQCFCGNGGYDEYGKSTKCTMRCAGNDKEFCGGRWSNSVYEIGNYFGCFRDAQDRALKGIYVSSVSMSVNWCKELCHDNNYNYIGLQFGRECFCGDSGFDKYGMSTSCNMDCNGNYQDTCGGYWDNSVYKIGDNP